MSIVIDDPDLERELRALAAERGERVEEVLRRVIRAGSGSVPEPVHAEDEQDRQRRLAEVRRLIDRIHAELHHDDRHPDEILGYDEHGLPR